MSILKNIAYIPCILIILFFNVFGYAAGLIYLGLWNGFLRAKQNAKDAYNEYGIKK